MQSSSNSWEDKASYNNYHRGRDSYICIKSCALPHCSTVAIFQTRSRIGTKKVATFVDHVWDAPGWDWGSVCDVLHQVHSVARHNTSLYEPRYWHFSSSNIASASASSGLADLTYVLAIQVTPDCYHAGFSLANAIIGVHFGHTLNGRRTRLLSRSVAWALWDILSYIIRARQWYCCHGLHRVSWEWVPLEDPFIMIFFTIPQ